MGNPIKHWARENNLGASSLCKEWDVSPGTYYRIMRPDLAKLSCGKLAKIWKYTGIPAEELLEYVLSVGDTDAN